MFIDAGSAISKSSGPLDLYATQRDEPGHEMSSDATDAEGQRAEAVLCYNNALSVAGAFTYFHPMSPLSIRSAICSASHSHPPGTVKAAWFSAFIAIP